MPLTLAEDKRPFMDARRMTNVGIALKGGKDAKPKGRPKPRQKQDMVSSQARLAYKIHEQRRQKYLAEINGSINLLGRTV